MLLTPGLGAQYSKMRFLPSCSYNLVRVQYGLIGPSIVEFRLHSQMGMNGILVVRQVVEPNLAIQPTRIRVSLVYSYLRSMKRSTLLSFSAARFSNQRK